MGWGDRLARSEENTGTKTEGDDQRGVARGDEGAWVHAGQRRSRAWARSSVPLGDGEDFRVVDVSGDRGEVQAVMIGGSDDTKNKNAVGANGVRVNKCFKDFLSRRESDKLVAQGRVTVNGLVVTAGARVFPGDKVFLDGRVVAWETMNVIDGDVSNLDDTQKRTSQFVYLKFWKPRGITCTTDSRDRSNIITALQYNSARVFPVGRLDKDSTGLILLTNDGRVPNAVLRGGARKDKKYVVVLDRPIREVDLRTVRNGLVISTPTRRDKVDRIVTAKTLPCECALVENRKGDSGGRKENTELKNRVVSITLREGRNRQIRRMFDALGYGVLELHRMEIMGIGLGGITSGTWAECDAGEMEIIKLCLSAPAERTEEPVETDDEEE